MKSIFPKGVIDKITGKCLVLSGNDIDTDRIIPARFLKCVSFNQLGDKVFADDRISLKGTHPFDLKVNKGSKILIVDENFGCGSSREHAPQALMRWGIRAIIGNSFAEIFYGNCLALGIPCATISKNEINNLKELIKQDQENIWEFNLKQQLLNHKDNRISFKIESGPLNMLRTGKWDATSQLMGNKEELNKTILNLPYLNKFN